MFSSSITAAEKQMVMGAGPSTFVVTLFFEHFSKKTTSKGYEFEVMQRSIKHAGGIRASDKYVFGRTGRPLNDKEKALNKREIFIARQPISMVVGQQVGVKTISLDALEKIISGKITNWNQLGGTDHEIILVGREKTEATFGVLKKKYPFFKLACFKKIFHRDHQLVNFLKSSNGDYALSFGASSNFDKKYHLNITGFEAGSNLGLVYDIKNSQHPLVKESMEFANSKTWADIIINNNFLPPEKIIKN